MAAHRAGKAAEASIIRAGGLTDASTVPMILYMGIPPVRGRRLLAPLTLLLVVVAIAPAASAAALPLVDQVQDTVHGATSVLPPPVQQAATTVTSRSTPTQQPSVHRAARPIAT